MTSMLIDAGINLTNHQFDGQHEAVIARAKAENINQMLLIGCDIPSSQQAQNLAKKHQLLATAGVHPHDAKTADQQLEQQPR